MIQIRSFFSCGVVLNFPSRFCPFYFMVWHNFRLLWCTSVHPTLQHIFSLTPQRTRRHFIASHACPCAKLVDVSLFGRMPRIPVNRWVDDRATIFLSPVDLSSEVVNERTCSVSGSTVHLSFRRSSLLGEMKSATRCQRHFHLDDIRDVSQSLFWLWLFAAAMFPLWLSSRFGSQVSMFSRKFLTFLCCL